MKRTHFRMHFLCCIIVFSLVVAPACTVQGTSPSYVPPPPAPPAAPAVDISASAQAATPPVLASDAPAVQQQPSSPSSSWNFSNASSFNQSLYNLSAYQPKPKKEYPPFVDYNGFGFVRKGDIWQTQVEANGQKVTMDFHFLPEEVEAVPLLGNVRDILYTSEVFITFDPKEEEFKHVALTAADISTHLATVYHIKPIASCTSDDPAACQTRPEKDCDDENVIYIKQAPDAMVLQRNTCVQVQGYDEDLLRAMTKMLMVWYGILGQ